MDHLIKPKHDSSILLSVATESAGWQYLSFKVVALKAGESYSEPTGRNEVALVPLIGKGLFDASGEHFEIARKGYFDERPHVLYAPPGKTITVTASTDLEFAIGGAPAEGKYSTRLFTPAEMKREIRGGGAARRQVNHILAHPLPAERLILFEVYVPGGAWSGWPPHCHDGYMGSPYLEEVYYYRIDPEDGFAIHRNYRRDKDFDELFAVQNGDLVLVTQGFHPVAAAPGSNVYFLNYLAGELLDEARGTPPLDDPAYAWIKDNWERNLLRLPIGNE
ncbi:MAG: 5-deoxy-glucuronate isomerase [Chloroflexi bacterium]|nr:5-deoxy-glucuronate isomerase [Chloroflexota bacterium]